MTDTSKRMTIEDFAAKLEWEGGVGNLIEYGLDSAEVPVALEEAWKQAQQTYRLFSEAENVIYAALEEVN